MIEELPFQEIEALLDSIISNKRLTRLDYIGGVEFIIFCFPKAQDLLLSRYMRDKALLTAQEEGLPTLEEAEGLSEKVTTQEDKDTLKEIQEKIEAQTSVLEMTSIDARKDQIQENIERLQDQAAPLQNKVHNILYLSQERKADEESFIFLTWASTYAVTGERFWDTFKEFEDETRHDLRASLFENFTKFNVGLPSKSIRFLARHSLWRIRYTAATKMGQQLFQDGLLDLTPDQMSLLYWSNYYQSIYEMLPDDQPSQEIIEDDEKLDEYMGDYFKNREQEKTEGKAAGRGGNKGGKLNAWERGEELIITPSHPEYMKLAYSEERLKIAEGTSEVEVINPNSRRSRNRRSRAKSKSAMRGGSR